jgi:hypothetical protein
MAMNGLVGTLLVFKPHRWKGGESQSVKEMAYTNINHMDPPVEMHRRRPA